MSEKGKKVERYMIQLNLHSESERRRWRDYAIKYCNQKGIPLKKNGEGHMNLYIMHCVNFTENSPSQLNEKVRDLMSQTSRETGLPVSTLIWTALNDFRKKEKLD